MLKKSALAFMLLLSLAGCKSKDAFNYSQDFVKKERALIPEITSTESKVKLFLAAEQYDSIAAAGERMESLVNATLKSVKDAPAPDAKEGENFKEAVVSYFAFIKSMYTLYKDFGNAKTPEAREAEMEKLRAIVDKKRDAINAIQGAQKKYADANNFKLETQ